jgi:hypothetical protein
MPYSLVIVLRDDITATLIVPPELLSHRWPVDYVFEVLPSIFDVRSERLLSGVWWTACSSLPLGTIGAFTRLAPPVGNAPTDPLR